MGGYLPLEPGVSTVRYPIPERIFDYVSAAGARRPEGAKSGIGLDPVLSFRTDFDQAPASSKPMRTEHLPLSAQATALIASIVETSDPESASYSLG